jgi:cyclopropane-fatty-acyl-phospholipid synthase
MQPTQSPTVQELTHAYGLDARFYALWLDRYRAYSCANWDGAADLEAAQLAKLDSALDALCLPRGGTFLDVGCGWGSLLQRGAERGYRGQGLVPVASQAAFCRQQGFDVNELPWQSVTSGQVYDGIASIGAFEHFAARKTSPAERSAQYGRFFAWSAQRLPEAGRMYLQTICFLADNIVDFSRLPKHVLMPLIRRLRPVRQEWPNSMLPVNLMEILAAADPYFEVVSVRARRRDYARTCAVWRERIAENRSEALALVGHKTVERFEGYLAAAGPAFEHGMMNLYQIVFSKRQTIAELAWTPEES